MQDEWRLTNLIPKFASEGYSLVQSKSYVWKLFHKTDSKEIPNKTVTYRFPFCDIFVMKKVKNVYVIRDKSGQNTWSNEFYSMEQISGIEFRLFGDYFLPCPKYPEEYLDRTYGSCWCSVGITNSLDHASENFMQSSSFNMEEIMYKPATPFR